MPVCIKTAETPNQDAYYCMLVTGGLPVYQISKGYFSVSYVKYKMCCVVYFFGP